MKKRHINVSLDEELYRSLLEFAAEQNLTISQAVRVLLRDARRIPSSTRDAGWREGYTAAVAALQKATAEAVGQVSSVATPVPRRPRGGR